MQNSKPGNVRVGLWVVLSLVALVVGASAGWLFSRPDSRAAIMADKAKPGLEPRVKVVEIGPMEDFEVRAVLVDRRLARTESFEQLMQRLKPYAAINGTFYGETLTPLGDIVTNSKLVNQGRYPNAIGVRSDGKVEFVRREGKVFDWSGYRSALAAGPRLIHGGKVHLDPLADGFSNMSLEIRAPRSGVGITRSGRLILVVAEEAVTLGEFAETMAGLGAVEAMNLDGGPACGLYRSGKVLVNPTLPMTNLLLVYRKG